MFLILQIVASSISRARAQTCAASTWHVSLASPPFRPSFQFSMGNELTLGMKVCRNLTDMSVFELASLSGLQRLSLMRVHKLTDIGLYSLAEHATELERLHLSYCDSLSLDAAHLMLRKLTRLQHLTATGVPAFRRKGIQRFSEPMPAVSDVCLSHRIYCLISSSNLELRSGSANRILRVQWGQRRASATIFGQGR